VKKAIAIFVAVLLVFAMASLSLATEEKKAAPDPASLDKSLHKEAIPLEKKTEPAEKKTVVPGTTVEKKAEPAEKKAEPAEKKTEPAEKKTHMKSALENLRNAKTHLEKAEPDKGGHRVKAINLVNSAIEEVQKGIEFSTKH
jgi:hypothetical protein